MTRWRWHRKGCSCPDCIRHTHAALTLGVIFAIALALPMFVLQVGNRGPGDPTGVDVQRDSITRFACQHPTDGVLLAADRLGVHVNLLTDCPPTGRERK